MKGGNVCIELLLLLFHSSPSTDTPIQDWTNWWIHVRQKGRERKKQPKKTKIASEVLLFCLFFNRHVRRKQKKSNIIWKSRVGWRAMVQQGKQTKRCIESSNVYKFNRPSFFWGWRNLPWWVSTKRSLQLPVQPALREPTGRVSCAFGIQWSFWACQPDRRRQRLDQLGQRRATVAILRRR